MKRAMVWVMLVLGMWGLAAWARPARAATPVVDALLFYAPGCPDCDAVLTQVLPPLLNKYGAQLHVLEVDVTTTAGRALYQAAIRQFQIPYSRWAVPMLIVGQSVMVGADEIPAQFPGLVDASLAQGGVGWPDLTGLADMLPPGDRPVTASTLSLTLSARMARDPVGTVLAVVVLVTLCMAAVYALVVFLRRRPKWADDEDDSFPAPVWQVWIVPLLALAGVGVAAYLSYVELTRTAAVCVAGGGCDTVQQSSYSRLFGVIPIGFVGMTGYVLILAAWVASRYRVARVADWGTLAGVGLAFFGTLFSIYLTYLEVFVIQASCIWCLASAEFMTVLLCLAAGPGRQAFAQLFNA